jgi:hypothetical protein
MSTEDDSTGEVSQSTGQRRAAAKPKRPMLSPMRIILFVLLAIMIGALIVDQRARHASQAALDDLNNALGKEGSISSVTRDEVHRLTGRAPDDDGNLDDAFERFSWQGVPYKHTVYVTYWGGTKRPLLKDASKVNELR